ncbi:unnamed protein product, partial [Adineta steineri]
SSFMIHLVLDSDKTATTPKVPQSKTTTTTTTTVPLTPTVTEVPVPQERPISSAHSATYDQYLDELNKYQQQLQQYLINPNGCLPVSNYNTQAYLEYCYTHYQMYQNLHAYQRTVVTPPTIVTNTMQQPASTTTTTAPPPAAAAAAAAPQPAAAGNNNNELEPENDLLGILNMLVELFVLCSIIYFYSTFSRFLVVFVIFALLYLHCRGYLSIQRRRRIQVQPIPVVPEQPAENNGEHVGEDEAEGEQAGNEAQNQNDIQRPRQTPSPPAPIVENQITTARLLFTAVSTFFSSLIPERPQRA